MSPLRALAAATTTSVRQNTVRQALTTASHSLARKQVVGESGNGLVRATLSGDGRIINLDVAPAIGKEGPRAIEKLVATAVNRAHDELREETRKAVINSLPADVDAKAVLRALP